MNMLNQKNINFGVIHTHEINPHDISDAHYILDYPEQFSNEDILEAEVYLRNTEGDPIDFN